MRLPKTHRHKTSGRLQTLINLGNNLNRTLYIQTSKRVPLNGVNQPTGAHQCHQPSSRLPNHGTNQTNNNGIRLLLYGTSLTNSSNGINSRSNLTGIVKLSNQPGISNPNKAGTSLSNPNKPGTSLSNPNKAGTSLSNNLGIIQGFLNPSPHKHWHFR